MKTKLFKLIGILFYLFLVFTTKIFSQNSIPDNITIVQNGNNYNIEFVLPDYYFDTITVTKEDSTIEKFIDIKVNDDFGIIDTIGLPILPQLTFMFIIPYDSAVTSIAIQNIQLEEQNLSTKIYPFQEPWSTNLELSERPFFINQSYYSSDGINYNPVSLSETYVIAGIKGIRVTVKPFVYNPLQNKLTIRKKINFDININKPYYTKSANVASLESYFSSLFVNYEPNTNKGITYGNYLIITAPQYEEMINRFANYKANIGYTVTVVTTNVTGTTKDNIKNYIQDLYDNTSTRPVFVLLVGDTDVIPNWIGSHNDNPPTDLNYSLLEGCDNEADVFLGRFSVRDNFQLENIINKTIYMETNVQNLTKDAVFAADFDCMGYFRAAHNRVVSHTFNNLGYNCHKLYATKKENDHCFLWIQVPNNHPASTTDLHNAINNNTIFFLYSGHGSRFSISDPTISINHISSNTFTNTSFPFTFSFACYTNCFTEYECVGEAWLRHENCGVSYFGASIPTFYGTDKQFEKKIFNKGFYNEDKEQLGIMIGYGKVKILNSMASNSRKTRYVEMYNLLGDPSLNTSGIDGCLTDFIFYNSVTYSNGDNVKFNVNNEIITAEGNSTFDVEGSANVVLVAGEQIVLKPGTHIAPVNGGSFLAYIAPCNSNSFDKSIKINNNTEDTTYVITKRNILKTNEHKTLVYPNPFRETTTIEYTIQGNSTVNIEVVNLLGVKIKSQNFKDLLKGTHTFQFSGNNLKNGIYIVKIQTQEYKETLFILKQ